MPILEPSARIIPTLIPIPARLEIYSTIEAEALLIDFSESPASITTHELNCRVGVRQPAIIGVGNEICRVDTAS